MLPASSVMSTATETAPSMSAPPETSTVQSPLFASNRRGCHRSALAVCQRDRDGLRVRVHTRQCQGDGTRLGIVNICIHGSDRENSTVLKIRSGIKSKLLKHSRCYPRRLSCHSDRYISVYECAA